MVRMRRRRRERLRAAVSFNEWTGEACTPGCQAWARRERERDRALPWAVRA